MLKSAHLLFMLVLLSGGSAAQTLAFTRNELDIKSSAPVVSPIVIQDIARVPVQVNRIIPGQTTRLVGKGMIVIGCGLEVAGVALIVDGIQTNRTGQQYAGPTGKNQSTGYGTVIEGIVVCLGGTALIITGTVVYKKGNRKYQDELYYMRRKTTLSLKIDSGLTLSYRF